MQGGKIKQSNQVECSRKGAIFRWNDQREGLSEGVTLEQRTEGVSPVHM